MSNSSKQHYECAFCRGVNLDIVMDFGSMGLAGGFLSRDALESEVKHKMQLGFCRDCYAVQILDQIDPDLMFRQGYFYFSSSIQTLKDHFKEYAEEVVDRFIIQPDEACVIEFGCNDGVLLTPLANKNIGTLIGVDPADNVVNTINDTRINIVNSYFDLNCAQSIVSDHGKADLILANNVFAHVSDINGLTMAIDAALSDDGIFIFEVHYLEKIVEEMQYDMIYHEHIYYYSLVSVENHFKRFNMMVFDVKKVKNHGGSVRFHVCRNGSRFATESTLVQDLRTRELNKGYDNSELFRKFGEKISKQKKDLLTLLKNIKASGLSIIGYGASGRANTLLQFCQIDNSLLDYMVDDAPAKTGFYTPGSHLQIKSKIPLVDQRPDFVVVFAWTFLREIYLRNLDYLKLGGRFIVPLPEVKVLDLSALKKLFPDT